MTCSFDNCSQTAIAICRGFGHRCGRMYCAQHGAAGFCWACGSERRNHLAEVSDKTRVRRILQEYGQLAERSPRLPGFTLAALSFALAVVPWLVLEMLGIPGVGLVVAIAATPTAWIMLTANMRRKERTWLTRATEARPGFREYYEIWQVERAYDERQALDNGAIVGAILGAAIVGAMIHEASRDI